MLREPVSFLHSLHALFLSSFNEHERDFSAALELEAQRKEDKALSSNALIPSRLYYSEVVKFSEQIERYFATFGRDNVKVILFDDFASNTRTVFEDVCQFLGIATECNVDLRVSNVSRAARFPFLRYVKGTFLARLPSYIPAAIRYPLFRKLHNIYYKQEKREKLDDALAQVLKQRYGSEVGDLGTLLGRDLITLWGYQDPLCQSTCRVAENQGNEEVVLGYGRWDAAEAVNSGDREDDAAAEGLATGVGQGDRHLEREVESSV